MKRLIVALVLVLVACTFVFAEVEPAVRYDDKIDFSFHPALAKYDGMGKSGIADSSRMDSFFINPSILGVKKGFAIHVVDFSVTLYNLQRTLSNKQAMQDFDAMLNGDEDAAVAFATTYMEGLGNGRNLIWKGDFGMGVKIGSFGLGTDVQIKLHTLNEGTSVASINIIPELNVAETVALGLKLIDTDAFSFSAGAAVHGIYKVYFKGIGGSKIINMISGSSDPEKVLLWDTPVMAGIAVPFDLGVTFGLFNDQLKLAATANNLNGTYHMKSYSGAGYLVNSVSPGTMPVPTDVPPAKDSVSFDVVTPWTLNIGIAFTPDINVIQPVLTADLVDTIGLFKAMGDGTFRASDLLLHLNVGAELGLFDILKARVGIDRGYLSFGTGIWLPFAQIDATYGWQEFGAEIGDKPVDSLTIRISLGYDK